MKRYNPKEIEPKWQAIWDESGTYTADLGSAKPKYIAMSMFNYPSGAGIHIGHAMNYTISDVKARFKRQQGYESYHPVGWDAFGLPAENYAIKADVSPQQSMAQIIPDYHKQYKAMGWSNDWEKEIATHLPEYYKWTQWIFAQMYKHGLAYQASRLQWYCEIDNTVLANEQVIDGKCWRHDGPDDPLVEKREIKQWFFKITDYADELLEATDALDWTESVKLAQKNWIGKSRGAEVDFMIDAKTDFVILHGFTATSKADFHPWLKKELEKKGHKVTVLDLPGTNHPDAKEQAEYVLSHAEFGENTVLVGHSYGSVTALRILEQLNKPIKKLVLIAGFAEPGFLDHERNFEKTTDWQFDFKKIKRNVADVRLLRPTNDSAVPQERVDDLRQKLGGAIFNFEASGNHATGKQEPFILRQLATKATVFTTRPDTLFGATFLVLAPEHELVQQITAPEQKAAVDEYVKQAQKKSELERQSQKEKTGVPTGAYAVNPINNEKIPVWIADYVLAGYGTGAIMAVPAHDERDHEFAEGFDLPIREVVEPQFGAASGGEKHKQAIIAVVRNPKDGKVLVLDWGPRRKNWGGNLFIGGGIEDGEDPVETAKREIAEETGYTEVRHVKTAETHINNFFYSNVKNQNYHARFLPILFELADDKQVERKLDDNEDQFTVRWVPENEIGNTITDEAHLHGYRLLTEKVCYHGEGVMVNSGDFDGQASSEARENIVKTLEKQGLAHEKINYRMNDWSVSRQRYWGAPIPIIHCKKCGTVLVPDEQLPVVLPELDDFAPSGDGRSALARATDWLNVPCPQCGGPAERETDTLDTYICSSWYMFRYFDPHNQEKIFDSSLVNKWAPIDFYNGGDHATAHLLYARFVARFFHKIGLIDNPEPFKQMLFNGKVTAADGSAFSKSKGNGIDPLEIIGQGYGADALRTYLMFAAPLELAARWDPQGVPGAHRFLSRLWNLAQEFLEAPEGKTDVEQAKELKRITHRTIKRMTEDLESNNYNTAIAAAMTAVNDLYKQKAEALAKNDDWREALTALTACVAPFAPHTAEELWHQLGHSTTVHRDSWPAYDEKYLAQDTVTVVVQVNGKLRGNVQVPADADEKTVVEAAKQNAKVATYLEGQTPKKTIYVPGKLVNFVL